VCPYSLTIPGGVQAQVLGLARELRRRGHEARVLAPCDGPPPELFVTPMGNSIPTSANGSVAPLAPDPAAALRTLRALRDEDFDVLHLHEPLAPGPTLTTLMAHPAPIVGTFHAAGDSSTYRRLNAAVRWTADRVDYRCAVSEDAKALASRYLGGTYDVLWNGVELERYGAGNSPKASGPTILFVGRHEPRKGLAVLLEAMTLLPPTVRCWIAGEGPDTAELKARYAGDPRLSWLGFLSEDEKIARMRAATVYCAPSLRGESFGIVLIEAMAAGTPVVASDIDGYRGVARAGQDALLTAPDDPSALAAGLGLMLDDAELAERYRHAGLARAAEFSMSTLAERYEAIYEQVRPTRRPEALWGATPTGLIRRIISASLY
jgi:phosphatidyl-myo-inositol alpha-mannosyltransferase